MVWVLGITAERGDEIQLGTVKGVPAANADHPVVPPTPLSSLPSCSLWLLASSGSHESSVTQP